jgi:hypothetical protein
MSYPNAPGQPTAPGAPLAAGSPVMPGRREAATPATPANGFDAHSGGPGGTRTDADDQSIGGLIAEVADDVSRLFRQEVELAKAELKTEAGKAGKAAGMLGGAGFAGYMVALFLSLSVMFGLAAVMPIGWAALIVTVVWGIAAGVLYTLGRKRMKDVHPVPEQTVESLKEDAQWLRNPTG